MVEGGLFKNEGRIVVYMTDDERKIPVKVSTKVLIGSIDGELASYSGIKGPIAAKRRRILHAFPDFSQLGGSLRRSTAGATLVPDREIFRPARRKPAIRSAPQSPRGWMHLS